MLRSLLAAGQGEPVAKRISTVLLILTSFALAATGSAQDVAMPPESRAPLQAMERLAPLIGEWDMTVFTTSDDGRNWEATPAQAVNLGFVHKGLAIEEIPQSLDGPGFHMRTYLTYDQYREVYRKAALDDVWGILDLYEGRFEDGRLVMTNLESGTFFPLENGRWRGFRLTLELNADSRWMWVDKTDDEGRSWQPAFKVQYVTRNR